MFIRDCWYVVAWDHEIPEHGLFHRKVLGDPLLLYRLESGRIVALEDRCCHRLAPLSVGKREGDCVRCGYHGLMFDAQGLCVDAPGLDRIPIKARVRSYPVEVRNKWVFVWMGEPQSADPALLPDNHSCDHPEWHYQPGYLHYDTPYLLICDNLLDFSHLSYVHENTLGGSTRIAQSRAEVQRVPRGIRVSRHVPDVPPSAYWRSFHSFEGNVDRWFIYDFLLPGTLLMDSGGRPTGQAEGDMSGAVRLHSCQTLTPETETTTHYFFQQAYHAPAENPEITATIFRGLLAAFEEDRAIITAQYRNLLLKPDAPMLPMAMDLALVQFRRLVEAELAREAGRRPADAPGAPSPDTRDPTTTETSHHA
jgi:phenylpropionate dioxygenase-like ring-hydroxylating dioxygenase large terminal subunit